MPEPASYDYCCLRVVPRVERQEFINVGIILFSRTRGFLAARIRLDEQRLKALSSDIDPGLVKRHLEAIPKICAGEPEAGPIARLTPSERFLWLASPRSTIIQTSPVHTGIHPSPENALEELFQRLVS